MADKPQKVAVLLGGKSTEREISLMTGDQIARALEENGYDVRKIDPAGNLAGELRDFQPDVAFIALHGKFGEDGTIQGMLEMLGVPYVGSGVLTSALAMDKVMTKKILLYEGITTPDCVFFNKRQVQSGEWGDFTRKVSERLGYPVVVKPACQGSTIGINIAKNKEELRKAVDEALAYDETGLVERFIDGTEITAAVLGTDEPRVLPLIEIVSDTGFYDYEAKYSSTLSHHIIPARVSEEVQQIAKELALRTYRALGCRQFSRVDFMVSKEGIPYVLEVNTIPGMTRTSLFPDAARAAGLSFNGLISFLVDEAWNLARNRPDR